MSSCQFDNTFVSGAPVVGAGLQTTTVVCPPQSDNDLHISGLVRFHLAAVPTYDGGQVFIQMQDAETGLRLGHATMDVRYHAGGSEPQTVLPGQTITMMMEFQAIDAVLPAGHGIEFVMTETGEDYLAPACGTACTVHVIPSASTVSLPIRSIDDYSVLKVPQPAEE